VSSKKTDIGKASIGQTVWQKQLRDD